MSESNPYAPQSDAKVVEPIAVEDTKQELEVPKGTVSEVLAWVDNDKERAEAALEAEKAGAKRVTLISALEDALKK